jgi:N4-(beta-N-acetylglucosaminyl)-L-asparaginase
MISNRRKFLKKATALSLFSLMINNSFSKNSGAQPIVISTWDAGIRANEAAWKILIDGNKCLDAVEKGVMVTESEVNCCVGLSGNPDREGIVTLDASIMDHLGNCGSVAALEQIAHPISVARKIMENTPHIMLVGKGAQEFAVSQGFKLEEQKLSPDAQKAFTEWLKKMDYIPAQNVENKKYGPFAPEKLENGDYNHDTIGLLAIDLLGNVAGACTTSGMGFKMKGRVGDSPIIGAGLFVDNKVGAATATGHGEEVIRIGGSHLVVEFMRQGFSPKMACKKAVERAFNLRGQQILNKQIGFIAVNKKGNYGAFSLNSGFTYSVCSKDIPNQVFTADHLL